MKGLVVPDQEEDFTADPVELFFDLAYVFAFSQIVGVLVHDPDWEHVGESILVFSMLWLAWSQVTWGANAVAGNSRYARLIFLAGTVASVPMAAAISTAFDGSGLLFAVPVVLILVLNFVLASQGARDEEGHFLAMSYFVGLGTSIVLLLAGGFVEDGLRIGLWTAAVAVFVAGTAATGSTDWTMRAGHFAERHGLILIVALGEVIVAVGKPLVESLEEGDSFTTSSVVTLVSAGLFGCLLWWAYFDRVQPALEHGVENLSGPERSSLARDGYTFLHLPVVAGVIAAAAGLEEITLHPTDPLPLAFRAMLFGGLALFFGGIALIAWRTYRVVATERMAAVAGSGVVLFAGSDLDGIWHVVAINAIVIVALVSEHVRVERPTSADPRSVARV